MTENDEEMTLWFDGASKSNPGKAGAGWVLKKGDVIEKRGGRYLGIATNNEAEYAGLTEGLKYVRKRYPKLRSIHVRGDSMLVLNQASGKWKCQANNLKPCLKRVHSLIEGLTVDWMYVPRKHNREADACANEAIPP